MRNTSVLGIRGLGTIVLALPFNIAQSISTACLNHVGMNSKAANGILVTNLDIKDSYSPQHEVQHGCDGRCELIFS